MKFVETRRERVYDGFLKIDKLYFKQENVNGEWTEEFSREVIYRRSQALQTIRCALKIQRLFELI